MKTYTGGFPIGFRRVRSEWQNDLPALLEWAQANDLEVIDLGRDADTQVAQVRSAGLRIGSADLPEWQGMISPDRARRADAIARNTAYIRACSDAAGPLNYFLVMLPEKPDLPRAENFGYMVESFAELAAVLEETGSHLAIEGWPGPGALCCTPEGFRAFFREVPSPAMGINYDPSHLLRMQIDPLRFLEEFADRVVHVHGKDTEFLSENLYEYGSELPPIFAERIRFGAITWRYTIPGHGVMRWRKAFQILADRGYQGCVSIELEDANFNGQPDTEQLGILLGARFLSGC
ncbi:MAG: hypothetical protein Kow0047_11480 [Anaerolineae bacterium]